MNSFHSHIVSKEEYNYDSNREFEENELLSDNMNKSETNIDNLVHESKINENIGHNINEYLNSNLDKENIYEKILSKLHQKQENFTNNTEYNNQQNDSEINQSELNNEHTEEIDLENFYENRQSLYEVALLRKSSTSKQKDSQKSKNNSNANYTKINSSLNQSNNTPRSNQDIKNISKSFRTQSSIKDKLPVNNSYDGIKSEKSVKFKNNNNSLNISNSLASNRINNVTKYEDYKISDKKSNQAKSKVNDNVLSARNSIQKSVDRSMPRSISRSYSDRLLSLNRSKSERKIISNDHVLLQNKSINLKIVNDSVEDIIDFEKIANISVSMIKSNRYVHNINSKDSSYKNIHDKRKYLDNSINSHSTRPQPSKNSTEIFVNMFRNTAKPLMQSVTNPKEMERINVTKLVVKEDIRCIKSNPIAAVSIVTRDDKELRINTSGNLGKINLRNRENIKSPAVKLNIYKESNANASKCNVKGINMPITPCKEESIVQKEELSIDNGEKSYVSTENNNKKLISINQSNNNSSKIYVKPRISNRLNKSCSTEKNRNSNVFEDFYQKNLNWKKTIQDDLKALKEQKQIDELKDCSFVPKVSDSTKKILSKNKSEKQDDFYLKNLKWKSKIEKFKQDEFVEKERKEFAECIFKPNHNSTKKINQLEESSKKMKGDYIYAKNIEWLHKISENKKIKQLELEEEFRDKPKHVSIRDRIDRSRSKSRSKLKKDSPALNEEKSFNELDSGKILDTERQRLKEDLSTINVRSNYLSSTSNRSNNFSVLSREIEHNSLEKDMKELKELVKSLANTLEENKKLLEENVERISDRSMNTTNNNYNFAINQSFNVAVNDVTNERRENANDISIKDIKTIKRVNSMNNIEVNSADYLDKYDKLIKIYNDHKKNRGKNQSSPNK